MTDEELNALVQELSEKQVCTGFEQTEPYTIDCVYGPDPVCQHAAATITTLRAQLAEARTKERQWVEKMVDAEARADRAEAALAAPEVMHEDAPAAIIGEIGNQIHNLGCELQNDEDASLRLSDLACRLWDAAKLFPTEPTALDRMLAGAREKALLEAVDVLRKWHDNLILCEFKEEPRTVGAAVDAILALIEKPNAR